MIQKESLQQIIQDKSNVETLNLELSQKINELNNQLRETERVSTEMINCLQNKVDFLTKTNEEKELELTNKSNKYKSFQGSKNLPRKTIPEFENAQELRKSRKEVLDLKDLIDRFEMNDCKMKQLLIEKEDEISQLKIKISNQLVEENMKIKLIIDENNSVKEQLNRQINELQIDIYKKSSIIDNLICSLRMNENMNEKSGQMKRNSNSDIEHISKFNSLNRLNPPLHITFRDRTERDIRIEPLNNQFCQESILKRRFESTQNLSSIHEEVKFILVFSNK